MGGMDFRGIMLFPAVIGFIVAAVIFGAIYFLFLH